jgi:hypothetical protein
MYVIDKRKGEQTLPEEQVDIWASYTVRLLFAIDFAILLRGIPAHPAVPPFPSEANCSRPQKSTKDSQKVVEKAGWPKHTVANHGDVHRSGKQVH